MESVAEELELCSLARYCWVAGRRTPLPECADLGEALKRLIDACCIQGSCEGTAEQLARRAGLNPETLMDLMRRVAWVHHTPIKWREVATPCMTFLYTGDPNTTIIAINKQLCKQT